MPIEVVEMTAALAAEYAAFVAAHPHSMIYSTLEFRDFLQRVAGGRPSYFAAVSEGRIRGVLPTFIKHDPTYGTVINSLPWYGSHGGCLIDGDDPDVRAALLSRYLATVTSLGADFATMIPYPQERAYQGAYLQALQPTTTDERISQVTNLPEDGTDLEQRLLNTCLQKTRNLVRKSLKQGFTHSLEDTDDGWQFLHQTHAANLAAIGGRAKPQSHFQALRDTIPVAWRQLVVARLDGAPAAAVLILRFNRTVEYLTPVIAHEFRPMQPLSFVIWHAMLESIRAGYRFWNWGGTWLSQQSLHHFKLGWGATDRTYHYYIHGSAPGLTRFKDDRDRLCAAFPYYFVFPFRETEA